MLNKLLTVILAVFGGMAFAADLEDEQIAKVLVTINEGEIAAADIAKSKATSPEVKEFAKMMASQHQTNKKETMALTKKSKLGSKTSELSETLAKDAKASNADIKKATGAAFDSAYVKQQVQMHENALATLKDKLIPNAKNDELRAHLEKTKAAVEEHLGHAKGLESKLQ